MAANQVGQVEIRVVPDGSQFGPQLQAILDAAAGKAGAAGRAIGQNISQQVVPQMQTVNRAVMDAGMQFDIAARKALVFTGAVMGTKATIEGMVNKMARLFDQLAQAQAGFSAIIGERKGKVLLDDIRQFAKESPFVTQQLVNYSQQLLGVGMAADKIVPLLKDTGNVIASVGGDTNNLSRVLYAMSQIQTVGRLMGQDAMQLQASLIPITKLLAQYLGKSTQEVKKLQEQGRISADEVFAAISAAGQRVPHAMDNAVRNIAGARAVLSDTITILMQDSPALKRIFEDIVKGIQVMAKTLDSPEVRKSIMGAFESIGKAYDSLKPLVESLIDVIGSGALSNLKLFSTTLDVLSSTIAAIPKPALEMLARVLGTIAMLKAPLLLMDYVKQFGRMAEIFKTGGMLTNMNVVFKKMADGQNPTKALVATNEQLASSYQLVSEAAIGAGESISGTSTVAARAAMGKYVSTAATASALAGAPGVVATTVPKETVTIAAPEALSTKYETMQTQMVRKQAEARFAMSPEEMLARKEGRLFSLEKFRESPKGVLQTPLSGRQQMGAAVGMSVVGGMMQSSDNASMQAVGNMMNMAGMGAMVSPTMAAPIIGGTIGSVTSIITAYKNLQATREAAVQETVQKQIDEAIEIQQRKTGALTGDTAAALQSRIDSYKKLVNEAQTTYDIALRGGGGTGTEDVIDIGKAEADLKRAKEFWGEIANGLTEKLSAMYGDQYSIMKNVLGEETSSGRIGKLFAGAYEQKTIIGPGGVAINTGQETLTADYAKLDKELAKYGLSLEQVGFLGEEATKRIINGLANVSTAQQKAIAGATRFNQVYDKAKLAAEGLYGSQGKMAGNQLATMSALTSAQEAATKAFENQGNAQAQLQAKQSISNAQITAYADKMAEITTMLEQSGKKLSDPEIESIAQAQALLAAENILDRLSVKSIETQETLQKQYKLTNDQLLQILGLEKKIVKNQKIVVTADVQQALEAYANLLAIQTTLQEQARTGGMQFDVRLRLSEVKAAMEAIMARFTNVPAATTGGTSGGGGQSFEDKVKSAAAALENSIKSAMDAVKGAAEAWKATIKERVQYEEAVGVGRAIRNAQRQATDISLLTTGIAQLKARGLTEEALTALDINSITDVRQVKRLLSSSPEELKRLSSTVAQRDKLASTLASDRQQEQNRKTITQAILEAARILGYKFTEEQAKAISAEFNITTETDAKKMIEDILKALSGGKITSVPT